MTTPLKEPVMSAKFPSKAEPIVAGKMSQVKLSFPADSNGDVQLVNAVQVPSPISSKRLDRSIKSRATIVSLYYHALVEPG